jgi:hypothetical protein
MVDREGQPKMKNQKIEVPATPSKFNATEEAILAYLYAHPRPEEIGAKDLARILKPEEEESWKETEEAIKTLIAARLVSGKRHRESEDVWHEKLRLTSKGEAEAIKEERRAKGGFTIDLSFIGGDPEGNREDPTPLTLSSLTDQEPGRSDANQHKPPRS